MTTNQSHSANHHLPTPKATQQAKDPEVRPGPPAWTSASYESFVSGSAASKLAASAVAPLVAAARGYRSVTPDTAEQFATRRGIGDRRTKKGKAFRSLFADGADALVLPGYCLQLLASTDAEPWGREATSSLIRPANPRTDEGGELVKYELAAGDPREVDAHPSITREWLRSAPTVLIAQGLLKSDAALTALLRAHFDDSVLSASATDVADTIPARDRLHALLSQLPVHERVAICSVSGPAGCGHTPDWQAVGLAGKEVHIALDGDLEQDFATWSMFDELYRYLHEQKQALPSVVRLSANHVVLEALAGGTRVGLDDFFARYGSWADLAQMTETHLPPRPARVARPEVGDWRVSPDGTSTQEFRAVLNGDGKFEKSRGEWVTRLPYGGRVTSIETRRAPTPQEKAGAPFGTGISGQKKTSHATIEISWTADSGETRAECVTGNTDILAETPGTWSRRGADTHPDVSLLPGWPPRQGREWMSAMKSNRVEDREHLTRWSTMGWVPVQDSSSQAFIAGTSILAATPEKAALTRPGVAGNTLANAERFGLDDVYTGPGLTDPTGLHNLATDLRALLDTYIVDSPWLDLNVAVTMLAAALRPAVPVPTSVAAYFVGAPQKGKSWSARQCMSFWQSRPGTWRNTLPGSANDTFATTESAVSKAPIWVVDDFAPSADRHNSDRLEARLGDLIRGLHNGSGKRRMGSGMTEQETPVPMALLIVTAENELSVQSLRERVVKVEFTGLRMKQMQRADALANKETTASRVTAALIRMFIAQGEDHGWDHVVRELRGVQESAVERAREVLVSFGVRLQDTSRPAQMAADLSLGLHAFSMLLQQAGLEREAAQIGWEAGDQWMRLLTELVGGSHLDKAEMSPGQVLLQCLRELLSAKGAHIENANEPGQPPLSGDGAASNVVLGWQASADGAWTPMGPTIGRVKTASDGSVVLWVDPETAFELAQRRYPRRILHGAKAQNHWRNFWDLGLAHPRYRDDGKRSIKRQVRLPNSDVRIDGVPMTLDLMLNRDPCE